MKKKIERGGYDGCGRGEDGEEKESEGWNINGRGERGLRKRIEEGWKRIGNEKEWRGGRG